MDVTLLVRVFLALTGVAIGFFLFLFITTVIHIEGHYRKPIRITYRSWCPVCNPSQ